jgi:CubicO group peptidase (beta-lactamase class C family)
MAELLAGGIDDWPVVGVEFVPGSRLAYSNAGYCVLQLVLEDWSGLTLHQLATQLMFGPLKMGHSRFDDPISGALLATAASGHRRETTADGQGHLAVPVERKARIAPAAAGGLWTTPTDLAGLAIEVSRAWRGESELLISKQLARAFLTPQVENEGLGIYLQGEGPTLAARHGGAMTGFTAQLVFYPEAGKGVALMVNCEGEGGQWLALELIASIADEYAWPGYPVRRILGTATPQQLDELVGVYGADSSPNLTFSVTVKDGKAIGQVNQYSSFEMQPTTETDLFVQPTTSLEIVFRRASDGRVAGVVLRRAGDIGTAFSRR